MPVITLPCVLLLSSANQPSHSRVAPPLPNRRAPGDLLRRLLHRHRRAAAVLAAVAGCEGPERDGDRPGADDRGGGEGDRPAARGARRRPPRRAAAADAGAGDGEPPRLRAVRLCRKLLATGVGQPAVLFAMAASDVA